MQAVWEGASAVKAVLEYDSATRRWFVWSPPTFMDRFFFFSKTGTEIIGSGHTKDEALWEARQAIKEGKYPRTRTREKIRL